MQLREDLEKEAKFILGRDVFDEIKNWYLYIFEKEWDYVFFTVRRSYVLALIFEEITGIGLNRNSTTEYL